MEFENIKSYLSVNTENGSVYDHLCKIVRYVSEERPDNAFLTFENISKAVKDQQLPREVAREFQAFDINSGTKEQILARVEQILKLYGKKEATHNAEDEDEEETQEEPDVSKVANVLEDQALLEWSGVCLETQELFTLQHSARELVKQNPSIETSRFFGKLFGVQNDYYIIECTLVEHPEPSEDDDPKNEAPGQGVNEYSYFVCSNLAATEWHQLPYVSSEQIKASRKVRTILTGNLDNMHFGGRFYFPWNEATFLRCLVARIASSCVLAPAGHFALPEEPDEANPLITELAEEFAAPEESASMDSWVHARGQLRLEGRLMKYVKPEAEDEDEEAKEAEPTPEEAEEVIEILRPITADSSPLISAPEDEEVDAEQVALWSIRQSPSNIPMQVTSIQSVLWPGAITAYRNGSRTFVNIYVGNGLKFHPTFYVPEPPLPFQQQFDEFTMVEVATEDEQTEMQKKSIFTVMPDALPPPPEENPVDDAEANADADAEAPAEE